MPLPMTMNRAYTSRPIPRLKGECMSPEQTMIALGSKSMSTVKRYAEFDGIEVRRQLMERVVPIKKGDNEHAKVSKETSSY